MIGHRRVVLAVPTTHHHEKVFKSWRLFHLHLNRGWIFIPSSSYFSILRIVIRVRGKAARSYQSSRIPCLLATSRLRSKTFPPLQTDVDTVEKGEMEFWCTVVGENFCSPFERAEESRRRRRRRRCLGQMKRESASRHREPLQRESVSVTKDFQSPPKYLPYSSKLFHARLGGMHIIFHRILCRFRVEVKVK